MIRPRDTSFNAETAVGPRRRRGGSTRHTYVCRRRRTLWELQHVNVGRRVQVLVVDDGARVPAARHRQSRRRISRRPAPSHTRPPHARCPQPTGRRDSAQKAITAPADIGPLTSAPLGYPAIRAPLGGGGRFCPPVKLPHHWPLVVERRGKRHPKALDTVRSYYKTCITRALEKV